MFAVCCRTLDLEKAHILGQTYPSFKIDFGDVSDAYLAGGRAYIETGVAGAAPDATPWQHPFDSTHQSDLSWWPRGRCAATSTLKLRHRNPLSNII